MTNKKEIFFEGAVVRHISMYPMAFFPPLRLLRLYGDVQGFDSLLLHPRIRRKIEMMDMSRVFEQAWEEPVCRIESEQREQKRSVRRSFSF